MSDYLPPHYWFVMGAFILGDISARISRPMLLWGKFLWGLVAFAAVYSYARWVS